MKTTDLFLIGLLLFILMACTSDDGDDNNMDDTTDETTTDETTDEDDDNGSIGSFTATITDITHNSAKISWNAPTAGSPLTYTVTVQDTEIESDLTATSYDLSSLDSGVAYDVEITATDGTNTSEALASFTSYVIDISQYNSMTGFVSATLKDCDYSEGGSGECYEIVFSANNVDDDNVHLCPETTGEVGGLGNYDGDGVDNGSATNGDPVGFTKLDGAFFAKMENDGFDIIKDGTDEIYIDTFEGMVPMGFDYCLEAAPDDNLTLTFQIPVVPEKLSSADNIESVEYIGLALDGTPINGEPPSVVDFGGGNIPSLDRCGGHQDPAGYYHWHFIAQNMNEILEDYGFYEAGVFECDHITQSATKLMGYARDGYPIYSKEDANGVPSDLDACNGHTGATAEYPEGIYHYHASTDVPNVPPCVIGKQSKDAFRKPQG